jgi:hypothetical protein
MKLLNQLCDVLSAKLLEQVFIPISKSISFLKLPQKSGNVKRSLAEGKDLTEDKIIGADMDILSMWQESPAQS